MSSIDNAERKAMRVLNDWVDAMVPRFNAVEMQDLKRRLTAAFREYEGNESFHLGLIVGMWTKSGRTVDEFREEYPTLWAKIEAMYEKH